MDFILYWIKQCFAYFYPKMFRIDVLSIILTPCDKTSFALVIMFASVAAQDTTRSRKVHQSCLSQEIRFSIFIGNISNPDRTWESTQSLSFWHGVSCNQRGEPRSIRWNGLELRAERLIWSSLPISMDTIVLSSNTLRGVVQWDEIPRELSLLDLSRNAFSGTLSTSDLPPKLLSLSLHSNEFTGPLQLRTLPSRLGYGYFGSNQFSGSLELSDLPERMCVLSLSRNMFSGIVHLDSLPRGLKILNLKGNDLQEIYPEKLPSCVLYGE